MNARTLLSLPRRGWLGASLVTGLLTVMLVACGDGREAPQTAAPTEGRLQPPSAALADPARCGDTMLVSSGPLGYRLDGGTCWRATSALAVTDGADGRRRALATAPTRPATAAELFDWAETAYTQFFPSRRSNLVLAGYTYRYYPESGNHVAVNDGRIYVQGPMSGGNLSYVGTVTEYTCLAVPSLCGLAGTDCAPIAQWSAGGNTCQAGNGQNARIANGASFTFTDTSGPLVGSATVRCTNGSLSDVGAHACYNEAPAACNTANLSWSVSGNLCSPNSGEPIQLQHGASYTFTDSVQTTGQAGYRCENGSLVLLSAPSCQAPTAQFCTPSDIQWSASGNVCVADNLPSQIADGSSYTFTDTRNGPVGSAVYRCNGGSLAMVGTPSCAPPQMVDSFGGDGGAADGGASGDGTAADGAPIVGGRVRVLDRNGRDATATTDSQGYFRVKLTGMVPPLMIRVTRPDGVVRSSISWQPLRTNGYVFMAVTGLTTKIVSDLARRADLPGAAALTPELASRLGPEALAAVLSELRSSAVVRPELQVAGLNPDTFDPLHAPFRPNGTGYDRVLDNLVVDTDTSGLTTVRTIYCNVQRLSWVVGSNTCSYGSASSAIIVMQPGTSLMFQDTAGPLIGTARYSCEKGLLTGPTSPTCYDSTSK